jgi:3-phytase
MTAKSKTFRHAHSRSNESWWTRLRLFTLRLVCLSSLAGNAFAATSVQPVVETDPSPHAGDTADDSVIWIHPIDPALSLVIGDDKDGGLIVWGLDGKQLQYVNGTLYNNIDLRYNFPLSGSFSDGTSHTHVALVGVGDEGNGEIDFFKVNPAARRLEPAGSVRTQSLIPYGSCMYHSPVSGKYYYFVNAKSGVVQQFDLSSASGTVTGQMVRTFDVGTQTEGCVADDELGYLYIGEELVGVWKYGAEPGGGATRTQVDAAGAGRLVADVEGVTIYYNSDRTGYLIVSSQGNSTFAVYTREGSNSYLGSFEVGANGSIDAVSGSDGLDVTNFPLGSGFPSGLLVVHDNANSGAAASNHKFVRWESVANALNLRVDTSRDPRRIGAGTPPPPPSNRQPTANPDTAWTTSGSSVTIAVLANDTDPDNHQLTITAVTNGRGGTVRVNTDSTVTYTASAAFSGTDTFNYTISDGNGGSATGTVTVTVNPPDAPPPSNRQPTANPDRATTTSGSSVTIAVLANDTDPDNHRLSVTSTTDGRGGSVSVNTDGTVTYTASAAFSGTDTFNYTISDGNGGSATGTVTVTVNPPAPPPDTGSTEFYLPQIVDGPVNDDEAFRTLIILSNPADTSATGTVTLKLADAETNDTVSEAISFRCLEDDQVTCAREGDMVYSTAEGVLSFGIAAKGQVVLMTDRNDSDRVRGYAKVTSDTPISATALIVRYEEEYDDDGSVDRTVLSQTAVPATGKMWRFAVTDFRGDSETALAVANPGTAATTLTLRRFAASGAESSTLATFTLAAGEDRIFYLKDVLSASSGSRFGMVIVESSTAPVTAVALKFDDDQFTVAPVIKIE